MRKLALTLVAGLFSLLGGSAAFAQGSGAGCPVQAMAPQIITATNYNLPSSAECAALVFTASAGATVNLPNPNTLAVGFPVTLVPAAAGGVTLDAPGAVTINGSTVPQFLPQGAGGQLLTDGNNWFFVTSGLISSPPQGAAFSNLSGSQVYPGTFLGNSPVVSLPNGVLQVTNPASIVASGDAIRVCNNVPKALGALPSQGAAFWNILDIWNRPYRIPLCP